MANPFGDPAGRVRRAVLAVFVVAVLATLGLLTMALIQPAQATKALRWWLLAVGQTSLVAVARVAARLLPILDRTSFDLAHERQVTSSELPERLHQIERLVASAGWSRSEFQARLRPSLRDIAAQRLATYRSIDIDAEPDHARAMLGEKVWALLEMREQDGPGIALGELQMVVDALESLDGSDDAPA